MSRLAVLQDMKKDVKKVLRNLHMIGDEAEDCVYLLQTSLIYNSRQHLKDCRLKLEKMIDTEQRTAQEIAELAEENQILTPYLYIPVHFMAIREGIEKLAGLMDKKITDGILFSDKAVGEMTFLLQRLIDLMRPTSDIILARNDILSRYIQESEVDVIRRALEYATLHEERLIEGICQPAASSLYLNMLDAVKSIAWHAKQIAIKIMA